VLRVVAGLFTAAAGAVFLLTGWMAISSRLGWNDRDLHGYGLTFGTILAILAGVRRDVHPADRGARHRVG